jgi:hypothetical protein
MVSCQLVPMTNFFATDFGRTVMDCVLNARNNFNEHAASGVEVLKPNENLST